MSGRAPQPMIESREAAAVAGLTYASLSGAGVRRRRAGKGFTYAGPDNGRLTDKAALKRIRALAIPPAWTDVWICPDPDGHIQAIGFDEKGRKQYRYHTAFREVRESAKFERMLQFAEVLPGLRRHVARDMAHPGLGRDKVLAAVVHLLETTMIRVGNAAYARENKSYGLTTLLNRHVRVDGAELRFNFKGKSGKVWRLNLKDRRIARVVRTCQDLPGQHLFQYMDDDGQPQAVTSADVNAYLKAVTGADVSAKDFRTWNGTVSAALALSEFDAAETLTRARSNVAEAIRAVSAQLGNTPTICRKCYVHPGVVSAYLDGRLALDIVAAPEGPSETLRPDETAVLAFLRRADQASQEPALR